VALSFLQFIGFIERLRGRLQFLKRLCRRHAFVVAFSVQSADSLAPKARFVAIAASCSRVGASQLEGPTTLRLRSFESPLVIVVVCSSKLVVRSLIEVERHPQNRIGWKDPFEPLFDLEPA
jgi:hypothetical protein